MTRTESVEWQERLFPRVRWERIDPVDGTHCSREIPPTLAEICLNLRAACNGSADPWSVEFLREVRDMLASRIQTWCHLRNDGMDAIVYVMVGEAIRWMATDFEQYRFMEGDGGPDAPRHRVDDPATVAEMVRARGA